MTERESFGHNFMHYFAGLVCCVTEEVILIFVFLIASVRHEDKNYIPLFMVGFILLILFYIIWRKILQKYDFIRLECNFIEVSRFNFGNFKVETLSTSQSKIRACECSSFLWWNRIVIKGPLGVTMTMYNIKNAEKLVNIIRGTW